MPNDINIMSDRNVLFSSGAGSDSGTVLRLETTRSDHDVARDIKARLIDASRPLIALINEAAAHDLVVNIQMVRDNFGRPQMQFILVKQFGD